MVLSLCVVALAGLLVGCNLGIASLTPTYGVHVGVKSMEEARRMGGAEGDTHR
jgi:hypothetical protein